MGKFIDLTGQKFGRLEVIKRAENSKDAKAQWECLCRCGAVVVVSGGNLRSGHTRSCGCLHREIISKPCSEETKRKMSKAQKGSNHPFYGKHHSEETKEKISKAVKGKNKGENHYKWYSDREYIKLNNKTKNLMYDLLYRTLRQTKPSKTARTYIMLGYTKEELMEDIEIKFINEMSWSNHGEWHIDHIKPVSSFVKEGITDPKVINALDNLQPLWAEDNLRKGSKYDEI